MLPRAVIVLLLAAAPRAGQAPAPAEPAQGPQLEALRARDARLAFTADSASRARAALEGAPENAWESVQADVEARAAAVLALGCGGGDGARIESILSDGEARERVAALFALGELGQAGLPALERLLAQDPLGLEEALCVALLLAEQRGASAALARLQALSGADDALGICARSALVARAGQSPRRIHDTLATYYELRWRAARAYGLVDGRRGRMALAAELFASEEFLDRVVLAAAVELGDAELRTHLGEILRAGEHLDALRVAALEMPDELARAHQAGEWRPSPAAWHAVLSEIDERRAERKALELLQLAYEASELEPRAGMLLVRAGGNMPWEWVGEQLERGGSEQRSALIEACGERGAKERIPELAELLERRPDLGIFGAGLVALARLGHPPARLTLEKLVGGPAGESEQGESAQREEVVTALARVLHDGNLRRFAEAALRRDDLPPAQRRALQVGLARSGAPVDREELRSALSQTRDDEQRLACVRALALQPEPADLEAFAALFPVEDELDLNVELALVLLRQRHAAANGLLRAALWSESPSGGSWNRSVLAGGLIVKGAGTRGLIDELDAAPPTASERDLRRVGFALGEWGGIAAVEELARTRSEGDPALQGALLGALSSRGGESAAPATKRPRIKLDFPPKGGAGKGPKAGR